jgi:hypothetical protein
MLSLAAEELFNQLWSEAGLPMDAPLYGDPLPAVAGAYPGFAGMPARE